MYISHSDIYKRHLLRLPLFSSLTAQHLTDLLQCCYNGRVGWLGAEVGVKEQRVAACTPRVLLLYGQSSSTCKQKPDTYWITNTPHGDSHAFWNA